MDLNNSNNNEFNNYNNYNNSSNDSFNGYGYDMNYREPNQGLYTASMILGIVAIISTFLLTVYVPFIAGGCSIMLGILSRGQLPKLPDKARIGITTAIIGMVLNIAIVGGSFYAVFTNPELKTQFDAAFEEMYGESFEDMIEDMKNGEEIEINRL